jgi:uncharacterized protein YndB with AHSA1/START domain
MFPIIIGVIAVIVLLFVVVVSMRPSEFKYERSTLITAPPSTIFARVNDLHKWEDWSPWAKLDPNMKMTFDGPAAGAGAAYGWSGNNKVGEGRMTILESRPSELIRFKLEFLRPMKATNMADFTFRPEGRQTRVVWIMSGKCNFISKAFGLLVDCDKMIGKDFEKGLAQLKAIAESNSSV